MIFSTAPRKIAAALLCASVSVFAYLPGEISTVTLPNSNGVFGNPALLSAFGSSGILIGAGESKDDVYNFRTGFNFDDFGAAFSYATDNRGIDESRWSLTNSFDVLDYVLFFGHRAEAFRSADFRGTDFSYAPGLLFRPWNWLAIGYESRNLGQVGPQHQRRVQAYGATIRPFKELSLSYTGENLNAHRLLLSATLYGMDFGFQIPLAGKNEEYKLTVSHSIGSHANAALTVFDDYRPRDFAVGYHFARDPDAHWKASVVRVPLNVPVTETESQGLPFIGSSTMGLETLRNHFEHLLADESAQLIIFDFSGYHGGSAASKEIQRGIVKLRKAGRHVVAYLDEVRPTVMLAASAADKIVLQPSARVTYRGLAGEVLYYKGFFDWIGVDVEMLRHGAYKSAVEPYTADSMSAEARSNMQTLYSNWWDALTEDMYERNGNKTSLDSFVNNPFLTAADAERFGLVDTVLYLDDVAPYALKALYDVDVPDAHYSTWAPKSGEMIFDEDWHFRSPVAVLHIDGTIVDGEGGFDPLTGSRSTGSAEVLDALDAVLASPGDYDALIVRINSPGGSAQASDVIWHRIRKISEAGLPVVASIGDMGASGGYYIACGADRIVAEKASIVGSIGIFGGKVNFSSLFSKLKIRPEVVKTHGHADAEGDSRAFTPEEKQALQAYMDDFYGRFLGVVSRETGISKNYLDSNLAGGRVFTGGEAVKTGLVQVIGGMDAAILEAKNLAGVDKNSPVELVPLLGDDSYIARSFKDQARLFGWVKSVEKTQVWALSPMCIFRDE